jgi:hypothetical protein
VRGAGTGTRFPAITGQNVMAISKRPDLAKTKIQRFIAKDKVTGIFLT